MTRRWHEVFSTALASRPRIGVYKAIRDHVGREPTRAELNAGRRAARSFAAGGNAVLVTILAAPGPGRPPTSMIVLARPGTDMSNADTVAAAASDEKPPVPARRPLGDPALVVPGLVKALNRAIDTARLMDMSRVSQDHAAQLAAALTEPIEKLSQIRNQLRRHARKQ